MSNRKNSLFNKMREQGIEDPRLRGDRGQNLFDMLSSLGVKNPKKQLMNFLSDLPDKGTNEGTSISSEDGTLSLGPWSSDGVLGFVNRTGYPLQISGEVARGFATIEWRRLEGVTKTLPITIPNGGVYEVYVTNLQSNNFSNSSRFYLAYQAKRV